MARFAVVAGGLKVHVLTEDGKDVLCGANKARTGANRYGYVRPREFSEDYVPHPGNLCKRCQNLAEGK